MNSAGKKREAAGRIPGLDGLRAISICLVLCGHTAGGHGLVGGAGFWNHTGDLGNFGVRIFFVISGYIITYLLLKELGRTETISLKDFYLRRTLRIFPASYFFLTIVTLAYSLHVIDLHRGDLLHAYTYTMNYFMSRSWWVGHLWSLSVEEQFYLLWPATLLLLGRSRGLKAAAAVLLLAPICRLATYYFWASQIASIGNSFPTVADAIATGCLLAGYKDELLRQPWFQRILSSRYFFLVPLAALALNARGGARLRWAVLETLMNILIALCVCRATVDVKSWGGRILNARALVFVGVLSYSLYLWQQLFFDKSSNAWVEQFPQNLVLAFVAALLCHQLIEKPFLKLRDTRKAKQAPKTAATPLLELQPVESAHTASVSGE